MNVKILREAVHDIRKIGAGTLQKALIDGTWDILLESKTKQHDIGVFRCEYDWGFEPVRAACSACKSKQVSTSSCVDCSSTTSIHSSSVIL